MAKYATVGMHAVCQTRGSHVSHYEDIRDACTRSVQRVSASLNLQLFLAVRNDRLGWFLPGLRAVLAATSPQLDREETRSRGPLPNTGERCQRCATIESRNKSEALLGETIDALPGNAG